MNKSLVTGVVVGVAAATAIGVAANYAHWPTGPESAPTVTVEPAYAEVLKTEPIYKATKTPRQVCKEETVTYKAPVKDENRVAGTAIGAVVGGLIGNQFGKGNGKTLATVGGAVAGGYTGNQIQKNVQDNDVQTKQVTHCETVYDTHKKITGYKVTYKLGDKQDTVRMNRDPGKRIPMKDGKLVLS